MARKPVLSDVELAEAKEMVRQGKALADVAERYGVARQTVSKWIIKYKWPVATERELRAQTEIELHRIKTEQAEAKVKGAKGDKGDKGAPKGASLVANDDMVRAEAKRRAALIANQQNDWEAIEKARMDALRMGDVAALCAEEWGAFLRGEREQPPPTTVDKVYVGAESAARYFATMAKGTKDMHIGQAKAYRMDLTPVKEAEDPTVTARKQELAKGINDMIVELRARSAKTINATATRPAHANP